MIGGIAGRLLQAAGVAVSAPPLDIPGYRPDEGPQAVFPMEDQLLADGRPVSKDRHCLDLLAGLLCRISQIHEHILYIYGV